MYIFAEDVNKKDISRLSLEMQFLLKYVHFWAKKREISLYITSLVRTIEQNRALNSKSTTHVDGRAVDFSVKKKWGWAYIDIQDLVSDLTNLVNTRCIGVCRNPYYNIGAISSHDLQQRPIVIHKNYNNGGDHAHLQVRRIL